MANERRLIDAREIMELFVEQLLRGPFDMGFALDEALKAAKTVDAVEVVRCKDCEHWTTEGNGYLDDSPYCGNPDGIDGYTKPDDFCSHGEKSSTQPQREEEEK